MSIICVYPRGLCVQRIRAHWFDFTALCILPLRLLPPVAHIIRQCHCDKMYSWSAVDRHKVISCQCRMECGHRTVWEESSPIWLVCLPQPGIVSWQQIILYCCSYLFLVWKTESVAVYNCYTPCSYLYQSTWKAVFALQVFLQLP